MSSFIEDIPREIEESAAIDGCSFLQGFLRITLPLIKGGVVTATLFNFIFAWNEFLLALCLTQKSVMPISVGLATFVGISGIHWGDLAAASLLMVYPIIVLSIILQKHIIRGLTFGALKE
jgi:multiple sugar transport system permease protein